jgi:hypothetical protein
MPLTIIMHLRRFGAMFVRIEPSRLRMQLLQHKVYVGKGEKVDHSWELRMKEPDAEESIQWLSSRWLDVATGCAVQPPDGSAELDFETQLLAVNGAHNVALTTENAKSDDQSEDEWMDPMGGWNESNMHHLDYDPTEDEEARECRRAPYRVVSVAIHIAVR